MDDVSSLRMKVIAELESAKLTNQLKQLETNIDDGIINNLSAQLSAINDGIRSATSVEDIKRLAELKGQVESELSSVNESASSEGSDSSGIIAAIMTIGAQAVAAISVISEVIKVLAAPLKIIQSAIRIVAEFLRPISDMLLVLFKPILMMLRPLLQIFRAMFAPFRTAMMKLSASGGIDINTGIIEQDMDLFKTGMLKSLSAVELGFAGFGQVITKALITAIKGISNIQFSIAKYLLKGILVGLSALVSVFSQPKARQLSAIGGTMLGGMDATFSNSMSFLDSLTDKAFDSWIGSMIERSANLGVDISNDLVQTLEEVSFGEIFSQAWENQKDIFSTIGSMTALILSGALDDALSSYEFGEIFDMFADNVANTLNSSIKTKWDNLMSTGNVTEAFSMSEIEAAISTFKTNVNNVGIPAAFTLLETNFSNLATKATESANTIAEALKELEDKKAIDIISEGVETDFGFKDYVPPEKNEESTKKSTSFFDNILSSIKKSFLSFNMSDISNPFIAATKLMLMTADSYFNNGAVPTSFETGMKEIYTDTVEYFNIVNSQTKQGYSNMTKSTTNFVSALNQSASATQMLLERIVKANNQAQSAARDASNYASSAYNAMLRARSSVVY